MDTQSLSAEEIEALRSPALAYLYARYTIRGRWPLGEPVIACDPRYAYWYALDIIRSRFALGEPVIAQDPKWANHYYSFFKRQFTDQERVVWLLRA